MKDFEWYQRFLGIYRPSLLSSVFTLQISWVTFFFSDSLVLANSQGGQQLQCYACGLPKVHPEYDVVGSYGLKKYNHSCEEMLDSKKNNNQIDQAFIRTCPVGVKSCFGATGFYDHKDNDKTNDICKYSGYVNIVTQVPARNSTLFVRLLDVTFYIQLALLCFSFQFSLSETHTDLVGKSCRQFFNLSICQNDMVASFM